jgi:AraC-like DNA-binding protein
VVPVQQVLGLAAKAVPFTEALIISTMPRGELQVAHRLNLSEGTIRQYHRTLHSEDRLTWRAMQGGKCVRAAHAFGSDAAFRTSPYAVGLLGAANPRFAVAAPLASPVFDGYPGALHLYRGIEQGDYSERELSLITRLAAQLDQLLARARDARGRAWGPSLNVSTRPTLKLMVLDQSLNEVSPTPMLSSLDERLREQITKHARRRMGHTPAEAASDRVQFPDSAADIWTFLSVTHRSCPALGDGPFLMLCVPPSCRDWSALRVSDLQGDPEISRMVPAVHFMEREFYRAPSLSAIAKSVHYSSFHFHRRFASLLGITPKHLLVEFQMQTAKRDLLLRKKRLAKVATDTGFAHQSHFTSRFGQMTGLTPTRWRRAIEATKLAPRTA